MSMRRVLRAGRPMAWPHFLKNTMQGKAAEANLLRGKQLPTCPEYQEAARNCWQLSVMSVGCLSLRMDSRLQRCENICMSLTGLGSSVCHPTPSTPLRGSSAGLSSSAPTGAGSLRNPSTVPTRNQLLTHARQARIAAAIRSPSRLSADDKSVPPAETGSLGN